MMLETLHDVSYLTQIAGRCCLPVDEFAFDVRTIDSPRRPFTNLVLSHVAKAWHDSL